MTAAGSAVLFDLDGTLLDLIVDFDRPRRRLAELFAPRGYTEEFRPILLRLREAAEQVAADDDERDELIARGRAIIDEAELDGVARARARPGAAAALAELARQQVPTGIVTDNGRACIADALAAAGLGTAGDFRVIVARDDVRMAKPDPEGVIRAARTLLPAGGTLWFVGDSPRDAAAGRMARAALAEIDVRIAGVAGGRGKPDDLEAAGAEVVLDDVGEVPEWIR